MRASIAIVLALMMPPLLAEESDPPSLELLEFLGSSEVEQASWMETVMTGLVAVNDAEKQSDTNDEQEHE